MMIGLPHSTYRLQLTPNFPFDAAAAVAPQIKALGITHVYASPFMKARAGSTHGYDIIDHTQINPELGGNDAFERLCAALKQSGLGLILDFVPNHMGVHFADNAWWLDVLEWGPKSRFANSFDIEWDILPFRNRPGILLPIFGAPYGDALTSGDLKLTFDDTSGALAIWYFEHKLPIAPQRYPDILRAIASAVPQLKDRLSDLIARFPSGKLTQPEQAQALKQALVTLRAVSQIRDGLKAYAAGPDKPAETAALHNLLERQHYRLAHWHLATSDINYRRFFDINTLAGLAVEDKKTFERIHSLVFRLIAEDKIQGLRLDHIDGLRDPAQYFVRLRKLIADARKGSKQPFYMLIEKILGHGEVLPKFAGVHGTTGYEWLNTISGVLVDTNGLNALSDTWRQASNDITSFATTTLDAKRRVIETLLASEFTVLVRLLARIAAGQYATRDYSEDSIRQALELYVLHFPVYRTYVTARGASPGERETIEFAIRRAQGDWFGADNGIFNFLRDVLTLDLVNRADSRHSRPRVMRFTFKLQQFTGPLMAKGLEDTAFYRYHRLLALNEVGGEPASPGVSVTQFHDAMRERAADWPYSMTGTATHDTKRGEDSRTRLLALSEVSGEWTHLVGQWKTLNAAFVAIDGNRRSPSIADEYMLYQALLGAMPLSGPTPDLAPRMKQFAQKAVREAKLQSSWLNPDEWYEMGVAVFVEKICEPKTPFMESFMPFARRLSLLGALNSLSQITLKAMMPGVPDFYQGTEFWDFSLVDPDNRRPVDMPARARELFEAATPPDWKSLAKAWQDGRIKLHWTHHLLALRNASPAAFSGGYVPLEVQGEHAGHILAFARSAGKNAIFVMALRHMAGFANGGRNWPEFRNIQAQVKLPAATTSGRTGKNSGGWHEVGGFLDALPVYAGEWS